MDACSGCMSPRLQGRRSRTERLPVPDGCVRVMELHWRCKGSKLEEGGGFADSRFGAFRVQDLGLQPSWSRWGYLITKASAS